jgi:hypothetical protein
MITADAVRDDVSPEKPEEPEKPKGKGASEAPRRPAPSSPVSPAGWLLRSSAVAAVFAGILAAIVAPGVQGNASERVVVCTAWGRARSRSSFSLLVTLAV